MSALSGLALAIGSLPAKSEQEAIELVFKYLPEAPFWPQLPKLNKQEGMVEQFLEGLPIAPGTSADQALEAFYGEITSRNLEAFKISRASAAGLYALKEKLKSDTDLLKNVKLIKCHITGPFTCAASLKGPSGNAYLGDPVFLQVFVEGLKMKALWQIEFFKEFGKPIVLFIDEPYLSAFGSAFSPINRDQVVEALRELSAGIKSENVFVGIHCCGNTDWSIFTDVYGIDIINFDAYSFWERFVLYAENLSHFLNRGGFVCWGIVPTEGFSDKITPEALVKRLEKAFAALEKKGISRELLYKQLLLSPACGLGSLDMQKSGKILNILAQTAKILLKKP